MVFAFLFTLTVLVTAFFLVGTVVLRGARLRVLPPQKNGKERKKYTSGKDSNNRLII